MSARRRSLVFAVATVILALIVVWAARHTWVELRQLHRSFATAQKDTFHLAEHLESGVRELNETVLRFEFRRRPPDRDAFARLSGDLARWARTNQVLVTTVRQRELLQKIETTLGVYQARTGALLEAAEPGTPTLGAGFIQDQLDEMAGPLLGLSSELAAAEREAHDRFLQDSLRALSWLQRLVVTLFVLLLVLVVTAAFALQRGVIGPLHVELVRSRAAAARHEKLASLGVLAAAVAHEIRNPLTAINVRLHGLRKHLVPDSSEHEDAVVIGHEIQRLERIVQEFLHFGRPPEPRRLAVSADRLLARVEALFMPQFEKTAIRLRLDREPDLWLHADPHQIEQVLINLIQNAAESLEREGVISLRVHTRAERLGGRWQPAVVFEVSDTGKGIPPEIQRRVFDPFFTTKEAGTGLGLAIAARIVEKHGGRLDCRSEVNRGTTFDLVLPQGQPEFSDASATSHPAH